MGISYNPKIATRGLVLHLDAANPRSYPGSGTTWYDLSGQGNNCTLINGVGYSSDNNGGLIFDGVSDYATIPSSFINFNNSTVVYLAKLSTGAGSRNTVFSQYYGGTGAQFEWQTSGYLRSNYRQSNAASPELDAPNGANQILVNIPYHVAVTYINGTIAHYLNSYFLGDSTNSTHTNIDGSNLINIGRNSSAGLNFKGLIYVVQIYNRVLTAEEVRQNFVAFHGRYGI